MFNKKLKQQNEELRAQLKLKNELCNMLQQQVHDASKHLDYVLDKFPFELDDTLYKLNKSKTKVLITTVTKSNYFDLVDKYVQKEVFLNEETAQEYIAELNVDKQ